MGDSKRLTMTMHLSRFDDSIMASTTAMSARAISTTVSTKTTRGKAMRRSTVTRAAFEGIYKEPHHGFTNEFIGETLEAFPDKGIADNLEAMILFVAGDYQILDVRAKSEIEYVGNYPRDQIYGPKITEIPIINATRRYDSEKGEKVYVQEINADFKAQVEKRFPDKETKLIIGCSDGRNRAIQALETLDEMGYVNIVGLRGGYNLWNRQWDSKLRRRNLPGVFKEEYQHGADGCGVHATGATFENQDAFQYADWRDSTEWLDSLEPATA